MGRRLDRDRGGDHENDEENEEDIGQRGYVYIGEDPAAPFFFLLCHLRILWAARAYAFQTTRLSSGRRVVSQLGFGSPLRRDRYRSCAGRLGNIQDSPYRPAALYG